MWRHIEAHYPRRGRHELAILVDTSELQTPRPAPASTKTTAQRVATTVAWLEGVVHGHAKAIRGVTLAEGADWNDNQPVSRIDRDVARGRRKVTVTSRSSHAISCAHVMIDLLKARPDTPEAYDETLKKAVQRDHPFMIKGRPWSTTVGLGEYLRRYGKQTAIAYGAFSGISLDAWLHDKRSGHRLYGQIGSTSMRTYDDIRHSSEVARLLAEGCFHALKERGIAPHFVETTAGRGGMTAALLDEGERHAEFSLVSFTNKSAELEHWLQQRRVDQSRFLLRRMAFDAIAHSEFLRGRVAILDIPWRMAGSFAGRPLRLLVQMCLTTCEVVFYTTAHGHRGLNIPGVRYDIRAIEGRELVCCYRR